MSPTYDAWCGLEDVVLPIYVYFKDNRIGNINKDWLRRLKLQQNVKRRNPRTLSSHLCVTHMGFDKLVTKEENAVSTIASLFNLQASRTNQPNPMPRNWTVYLRQYTSEATLI